MPAGESTERTISTRMLARAPALYGVALSRPPIKDCRRRALRTHRVENCRVSSIALVVLGRLFGAWVDVGILDRPGLKAECPGMLRNLRKRCNPYPGSARYLGHEFAELTRPAGAT